MNINEYDDKYSTVALAFQRSKWLLECEQLSMRNFSEYTDEMKSYDSQMYDQSVARTRNEFLQFLQSDQNDVDSAREFQVNTIIEQWAAGAMLKLSETFVPVRGIESILISDRGDGPRAQLVHRGIWHIPVEAFPKRPARITITMCSGNKHKMICTRHHVEIIHAALLNAWKTEGKTNEI